MRVNLTEKQIDVLVSAAESALAGGPDGDAFESMDEVRRLRYVCDKLKGLRDHE